MLKKKAFWIVLLILALAGGGGYAAYASGLVPWFAPKATEVEETTLQTATVTVGDLSITADGSGMLVASSEVELAFSTNSTLMELLIRVGDVVQVGDVLAWIDDTDARKAVSDAELSVLQAEDALEKAGDTTDLEQAVMQAELKVVQGEANLASAQDDLEALLDWVPDETEVEVAKASLVIAQIGYQNTVAKANMRDQQLASTRIKLEDTVRDLSEAQINYADAMDAAHDWERNIESRRESATKALKKAQDNLEIAQATYDMAMIDTRQIDIQNDRVRVLNAEETLNDLQAPPEEQDIASARIVVQEMQVALQQAKWDLAAAREALAEADTTQAELTLQQARLKRESAQEALEGTTIVAPISGTVVEINADVGEKVSGTAIVLADLTAPVVQFWVEESDLTSVVVGHPVRIVFEALPDLTYDGQITRVDPVLVSVGNTPAAQAWASIDTAAHPVKLLGDMNAEVEIVAGEALNALLVPVQALRKLGEDQYAVFVVQPNGELEFRMVEVGLMDYVNAEVRSGLRNGEVVSTGETTSTSSSEPVTNPDMPLPMGPGMRFMGG